MTVLSRLRLDSAKSGQTITSVAVIFMGSMVLIGWLFNSAALKSVLPGLASMKANTALCLVLIGLALWTLRDEPMTPRRRSVALSCAVIVFLIGFLTLVQYVFDWNFGIDQLLFQDTASSESVSFPGRMAHATALGFIMAGLSLWLMSTDQRPALAQLFALFVIGIALFALPGYLYGVASLYGFFLFSSVALHTAIALLICGIGMLLSRPHRGWVAVLSGDYSGGIMARRLLPAVLTVPFITGGLALAGTYYGIYSGEIEVVVTTLANVMLFAPLIWWSAHLLNEADAQRRQDAERIRRLNRTLAVLSDINQAIVRIRHIPTLFEKACQIAIDKGKFRLIWIGLVDPVTGKVTLAAHAGVSNDYQERLKRAVNDDTRMQTLVDNLRRAADPVVFNDVQADPQFSPQVREDGELLDLRSLVLLPLWVSGALRGVVSLYADEQDRFDDAELRLLVEMAADIGFAMEFADQEAQREKSEAELMRYREQLEHLVAERTEQLRQSEEKFSKAFRASPAAISIATLPDGRWIEINEALANMTGYSSEELIGHTSLELGLVDAVARAKIVEAIQTQGAVRNEEIQLHTKSQEIVDVLVSVEQIEINGQACALTIQYDITELKRALREVQRLNEDLEHRQLALEAVNKELEAFSYSVSHDLRAPLRTLDGFSQMLLDEYREMLDANGQRMLQRIRAGSEMMAQLIDALLDLARVARVELHVEPVNLSALAHTIQIELQEQNPERQVECIIHDGLAVRGDHGLLNIVLTNLLNNAWKFTRQQPNARIEFGITDHEALQAYFVRDNGAGFDMAYAEKLFGAFQRLHQTSAYEGTGIGLATVERIIHRHGGRIWAEAAVNEGATFYFTLEA